MNLDALAETDLTSLAWTCRRADADGFCGASGFPLARE